VSVGRGAKILAVAFVATGCAASRTPTGPAIDGRRLPTPAAAAGDVDRPSLVSVVRDGDGAGAVAVAVTTAGVAEDLGALAAVALAALVQERLAARGVDATATGGWNGWRVRAIVASSAAAERIVLALREAMLAPVLAGEPALSAVERKAAALARRPLPDPSLVGVARCTGEAYGLGDGALPTFTELESWRAAAIGIGRIAVAAAGDEAIVRAVGESLARTRPWPRAIPPSTPARSGDDDRALVYEASGEVAPGSARIVVTARTATPARAVAVAPGLGNPRGALALRLAALDGPAHVRSVVATAQLDGGCVALTLDLDARDLGSSGLSRIATAAALARQEMSVEIADGAEGTDAADESARRAPDPREAAERAAWWALARPRSEPSDLEPRLGLTVGVAAARDATDAPNADVLRAEIDRATLAWRAPVVEGRVRVERGQGEAWILLASPCGTWSESSSDAGLGAAAAVAAAAQAEGEAGDARVEPFIDVDGLGVVIHGPAHPGETSHAHARRIADVAARALAAVPLEPGRVEAATVALLTRSSDTQARLLATLGDALAPGHPSWLLPGGTMLGLTAATNDAVAARVAALRAGPLRVAVLADADAMQAGVAVSAVDRWVARRPGDARACPSLPALLPPRSGTYAVDVPMGAPSEVLMAAPLPVSDAAARRAAIGMAAALDGPDGLLARALGADGHSGTPPLARAWSAWVAGAPAGALVVRIVAADGSLDAAVAQARAVLDRLRHGALRDEDRVRAAAALARAAAGAFDPRARLVDLWRGEPPYAMPAIDELRTFAAASLRDQDLIIVAARPARPTPGRR